MKNTPKSLRLQIGIFGRTNVGKSSFLNMVAGQDVAITSPVPGTTTDVVEKTMELLPVGPVVFLDTAGIDDTSELSSERIRKTKKIFDRSDILILLTEAGKWGKYENSIMNEASLRDIPVIVAVNRSDENYPSEKFLEELKNKTSYIMVISSVDGKRRNEYIVGLKAHIMEICPDDFLNPPKLIGDLLPEGGMAVLIVPIDKEAPKGRIILPQVQAIRDALDSDCSTVVVKENGYSDVLKRLKKQPDLVVCDSQVVDRMVRETPPEVKCTTFSILFARYKSDIVENARAAGWIGTLKPGDRVLIAEACSHHPIEDDIGRVKIPAWLKKYAGGALDIDVSAGRDYPEDLKDYKLVIHCGSCMLTRRETLARMYRARRAGVMVTNYGMCIAYTQGVIERVLAPFPEALSAFKEKQGSYGS